jgi:hypothetical protein
MRYLTLILAWLVMGFAVFVGWILFHNMPPFNVGLLFKAWLPIIICGAGVIYLFIYAHLQFTRVTRIGPIPFTLDDSNRNGPIVMINFEKGETRSIGGPRSFPRSDRDWLKQLHSLKEEERQAAIEKLVERGPDILPMLFYHCREEGGDYRAAVLTVIDRVHPRGLMAALTEALPVVDTHSAWQICNVFRDMGEQAVPAIPALIAALRKGDSFVAGKAGTALGYTGMAAVQPLLEIFCDRSLPEDVRWEAAQALEICFMRADNGEPWQRMIAEAREVFQPIAADPTEPEEVRAWAADLPDRAWKEMSY